MHEEANGIFFLFLQYFLAYPQQNNLSDMAEFTAARSFEVNPEWSKAMDQVITGVREALQDLESCPIQTVKVYRKWFSEKARKYLDDNDFLNKVPEVLEQSLHGCAVAWSEGEEEGIGQALVVSKASPRPSKRPLPMDDPAAKRLRTDAPMTPPRLRQSFTFVSPVHPLRKADVEAWAEQSPNPVIIFSKDHLRAVVGIDAGESPPKGAIQGIPPTPHVEVVLELKKVEKGFLTTHGLACAQKAFADTNKTDVFHKCIKLAVPGIDEYLDVFCKLDESQQLPESEYTFRFRTAFPQEKFDALVLKKDIWVRAYDTNWFLEVKPWYATFICVHPIDMWCSCFCRHCIMEHMPTTMQHRLGLVRAVSA